MMALAGLSDVRLKPRQVQPVFSPDQFRAWRLLELLLISRSTTGILFSENGEPPSLKSNEIALLAKDFSS
jgi:hypothetical protein